MKDYIPLMSRDGRQIGLEEKMIVHEKGLLHRAFSIFLFNKDKKMYIQKRAKEKYHCPNLWTNTCCSHPKTGIIKLNELETKLDQEMGMEFSELEHLYDFIYRKKFDNGLIEHELDSVYVGFSNDKPKINPIEVGDWKVIKMKSLQKEMRDNPENFTYWFKKIVGNKKFGKWIRKNIDSKFYYSFK